MQPLKNAKWERFALGIAQGMPQGRAYEAAGYSATGNGAEVNASRLLKNARVAARVAQLQQAKAERVVERETLDRLWVLDRLMRNARICMGEERVKMSVKPKGADAPVEIEVTQRDAAAANQALQLLGKELGLFVDRSEVLNVVRDITDEPLTDEEWAERHVTAH